MTDDSFKYTPQEISDVMLAFPADVEDLMPPREECEEELAKLSPEERAKWLNFQSHWFSQGLHESTEFDLYEGIDGETAIRHLAAIQGSFQPKHEHKMAAVAYLASLWFADVRL